MALNVLSSTYHEQCSPAIPSWLCCSYHPEPLSWWYIFSLPSRSLHCGEGYSFVFKTIRSIDTITLNYMEALHMEYARLCLACQTPLTNKRSHAVTCSGKCRSKKWRALKEQSVLIPFRLPTSLHTDLFLAAYARNQGINTYLTRLVGDHLANAH